MVLLEDMYALKFFRVGVVRLRLILTPIIPMILYTLWFFKVESVDSGVNGLKDSTLAGDGTTSY